MFCLATACTGTIHIYYSLHYACIVSTSIYCCVILQRPSEPVLSHNLHALHRHSFFRHIHDSSHYACVDFTIVQNGAPLTSFAAFDVLGELQSTRFGWIRTVVCSRLSCSGLRSTGLLGGCWPSRRSFLWSDFVLFSLVSFFGGHNSVTASLATAVSAGAATAGVRAKRHRVALLCSFRDYISYCSSSEVGVLKYVYMVNNHRPAFPKPLSAF